MFFSCNSYYCRCWFTVAHTVADINYLQFISLQMFTAFNVYLLRINADVICCILMRMLLSCILYCCRFFFHAIHIIADVDLLRIILLHMLISCNLYHCRWLLRLMFIYCVLMSMLLSCILSCCRCFFHAIHIVADVNFL